MAILNERKDFQDLDRTLPKPPKIIIDVLSEFNYGAGAEEMRYKIEKSFENGMEAVWLVHTGVARTGRGVQVMVGKYDERAPLLVDKEAINDVGLGMGITASDLLLEE
eukprot:TRINITY_DN3430_c0_g1_i1.p1 TRINITY_DN3430_c0_g1~~TRINITY_DN3430_c0_g1_i1.p1  ORF type:complete len:108 (+),score=38.43 TRINITY_DN3430_c0_g1_i1:285-608(+)